MILAVPLILVALAIILGYLAYTTHFPKNYDQMQKFPNPHVYPILGNVVPTNQAEMTKLVYDYHTTIGSPYVMKLGTTYFVMIAAPELVEAVLRNTDNLNKGQSYKFVKPWLGEGLLISTGDKWKRHRKMLTPTFHFKILNSFLPIMNEQSLILVDIIKTKLLTDGQAIDFAPLLTNCTLDLILETSMGKSVNAQRSQKRGSYCQAICDFADAGNYQATRPWLWNEDVFALLTGLGRQKKRALKVLHDYTTKMIREREESFNSGDISLDVPENQEETTTKRRLAFLDLLLDMKRKGQLTELELQEEVDTFLFEGHDTTATALMYAVYCLGRNPEYQRRCQEELDSILGPDLSTCPTPEDLTQMKYLECCIKESQRIYPSVPYIEREVTTPINVEGYPEIPAGVTVAMMFRNLHHNAKHFPDPLKYDPDRFLAENAVGRHPYAFTPFSAGPRNCIGQKYAVMEEKIVLCHILRNFDLEALDKQEDMVVEMALILRPTNGIWIKAKVRDVK